MLVFQSTGIFIPSSAHNGNVDFDSSGGKRAQQFMHILFLYASTGSGHLKAARYVEEALLETNRPVTVANADVLSLCCYPVEAFALKAFRTLISRMPNIYRLLYRCTENNDLFNRLAGLFFTRSIDELKRKCLSSHISVIVCTHPLSLLFASRLKKKWVKKLRLSWGLLPIIRYTDSGCIRGLTGIACPPGK